MPEEVKMPKLGMTMVEGKVSKWLKNDKEYVEKDEPLVEIATDKIVSVLKSLGTGYLEIKVQSGEKRKVGDIIAYIHEKADAHAEEAIETILDSIGRIKASPVAKRLAKEHDIDLSKVKPLSGDYIQKEDVLEHVSQMGKSSEIAGKDLKITPAAKKLASDLSIDLSALGNRGKRIYKKDLFEVKATGQFIDQTEQYIEFSEMRKAIFDNMTKSASTIPHVTISSEVNMSEVMSLRLQFNNANAQNKGCRITYNDFIIKATANALKDCPSINSQVVGNAIKRMGTINIGLAVAVDDGLLVPVICNADQLSIIEIAELSTSLVDKAKQGLLSYDDLGNGTFTITSLGSYGIDMFTPIINYPESAILGVGCIKKVPVVKDESIQILPIIILSLSFDHRIIDGAPAAIFLQKIRYYLENPILLFC